MVTTPMTVSIENPKIALVILQTARDAGFRVCGRYESTLISDIEKGMPATYEFMYLDNIDGSVRGKNMTDATHTIDDIVKVFSKREKITVKISKDYNAEYTAGAKEIKVGCQTIKLEDLETLVKEIERVNGGKKVY